MATKRLRVITPHKDGDSFGDLPYASPGYSLARAIIYATTLPYAGATHRVKYSKQLNSAVKDGESGDEKGGFGRLVL